jgi:hypothetical protein
MGFFGLRALQSGFSILCFGCLLPLGLLTSAGCGSRGAAPAASPAGLGEMAASIKAGKMTPLEARNAFLDKVRPTRKFLQSKSPARKKTRPSTSK